MKVSCKRPPVALCMVFVLVFLCCQDTTLFSLTPRTRVKSLSEWYLANPAQIEISSCFNKIVTADAKPPKYPSGIRPKIAIVYPAIQESDYWTRNVKAFESRLIELTLPYRIEKHYYSPGDLDLQLQMISEALKSDPDYLALTLDTPADTAIIQRLLNRERPKIILQNITTPVANFNINKPLIYIGFDHELGSKQLANYYCKKFPKGGTKWAMLLFTDGYVSNQRAGGFAKAINVLPKMQLQDVYLTDGKKEKSFKATKEIIARHPDLDFIFACSTDVALGAIEAVNVAKAHRRVLVNGWGGGKAEIDELLSGRLSLTVMRMNDDAGVAMAEAISADVLGKSHLIPIIFSGSFELIDKDTSPERLEKLQKKAFRYSGTEAENE